MISFTNRSIAAAAAAFATAITVVAATPVRAETRQTAVRYADLDVHSDAGRATLARRVRHAADAVCGQQDAINYLRVAQCRRVAIADADAQFAAQQRRVAVASR